MAAGREPTGRGAAGQTGNKEDAEWHRVRAKGKGGRGSSLAP